MKVVGIVQARTGSTRLPGKVLKEVAGESLLGHHLRRVTQAKTLSHIVVATTTEAGDDPLIPIAEQHGCQIYRGSESDVLSRYWDGSGDADVIVRLCSDCPLIDPVVIDHVVTYFLNGEYDYVSNTFDRGFPRGMDVEVISRKALQTAYSEATAPDEREHVTLFFHRNSDRFRMGKYDYRLTVDTEDDFELISYLIETLPANYSLADVVAHLQNHPHLVEKNTEVVQWAP